MGAAIFIGGAGLGTLLAFDVIAIVTFICSAVLGVMCAAGGALRNRVSILTKVGIGGACLGTLLTIRVVAIVTFRAVLGIVLRGAASRNRRPIRAGIGIDYACLGSFLALRVVAVFARLTVFLVVFCGCPGNSRSVGAGVVATAASSVCSVSAVSSPFVTREGQQEGRQNQVGDGATMPSPPPPLFPIHGRDYFSK